MVQAKVLLHELHIFIDPNTFGADRDVLLPDGFHKTNAIPEALPETG